MYVYVCTAIRLYTKEFVADTSLEVKLYVGSEDVNVMVTVALWVPPSDTAEEVKVMVGEVASCVQLYVFD